ncbi:MAG TPA: hypothetical protein VMT33_06420 [Candidatus Bathyarchaeia archaeon]|nr:hypothetical protein [Candidatus Bathyarchaeia archaeon]
MKRPGRVAILSILVLGLAGFGANDLRAVCGVPGIVTSSSFGGGTGTVILYSPVAPFNFTGMATVTFGPAAADRQWELWRTAIADVPTNYLSVVAPAPPNAPACQICAIAPGAYPNCNNPTITMLYD